MADYWALHLQMETQMETQRRRDEKMVYPKLMADSKGETMAEKRAERR